MVAYLERQVGLSNHALSLWFVNLNEPCHIWYVKGCKA